jgi:hypothetical protein
LCGLLVPLCDLLESLACLLVQAITASLKGPLKKNMWKNRKLVSYSNQ